MNQLRKLKLAPNPLYWLARRLCVPLLLSPALALAAGGNVLLSVALCLIATWLGYLVGSAFTAMKGN